MGIGVVPAGLEAPPLVGGGDVSTVTVFAGDVPDEGPPVGAALVDPLRVCVAVEGCDPLAALRPLEPEFEGWAATAVPASSINRHAALRPALWD